jgi:hypothetical protein
MVRLEKFNKCAYADLISWIDSKEMLMQFAGPSFDFPLTNEQQINLLVMQIDLLSEW